MVFHSIINVQTSLSAAGDITVVIHADGDIPFPQVIVWDGSRQVLLLKDSDIRQTDSRAYTAVIAAGVLRPGRYTLQVEGCQRADISAARPEEWIKHYQPLDIPAGSAAAATSVPAQPICRDTDEPKLYFCIHKHMHQPYYRAANTDFWDGMNDEIFFSRAGAYRSFINRAASQYAPLPDAGLSMSWAGSLVEQLNRVSKDGLAHGAFGGDWKAEVRAAAQQRTANGTPRADFSAFGFFHPLMPLIPRRDIVRQITLHREMVRTEFGVEAARYLFPPETAFHVRIIPALLEAGIDAVIYDSIHRYRACRDYPYAGKTEGMLPPNKADQTNPPVTDWLQLHNVWAGSKIAPSLLKPEYVKYTDVDGKEYTIIAIPAERYIGNEDARGGFGALQYPDVLGQVRDAIIASGQYDPKHPPFFILHSDGDNHGGGAESYYGSNTGAMVHWLMNDPRFECIAIRDYLDRFPPDPEQAVHIEPGSWSGADNGDPQFMKWFSGYNNSYSPDLNSWAVLTMLQNTVHTVLDACPDADAAHRAERLLLTAEASDYWYWTGQTVWDTQVTAAANAALEVLQPLMVRAAGADKTGPTIFPPWITPENPGGLAWGNNGEQVPAGKVGTVHTFMYDVSGIRSARLIMRTDAGMGPEREIPLVDRGDYPCRTGAQATARYYTAELPAGAGDIRYWLEATDNAGNTTRGALERVYLG